MSARVALKVGQIWEHFASTCVRDGALNGTYELTAIPVVNDKPVGLVHLTNLEDGEGRQGLSRCPDRRPPAQAAPALAFEGGRG